MSRPYRPLSCDPKGVPELSSTPGATPAGVWSCSCPPKHPLPNPPLASDSAPQTHLRGLELLLPYKSQPWGLTLPPNPPQSMGLPLNPTPKPTQGYGATPKPTLQYEAAPQTYPGVWGCPPTLPSNPPQGMGLPSNPPMGLTLLPNPPF